MATYYEFPGDALLPAEQQTLIQDPTTYYKDMHQLIEGVAGLYDVTLSAPTQERLLRGLSWCNYLDELADRPGLNKAGLTFYEDSIGAIRPNWTPRFEADSATDETGTAAYTWARIVRSSLQAEDMSDARRENLHATALSLGHIANQKKRAPTLRQYTRVGRAEGVLIADLLCNFMSDDEVATPEIRGMRSVLRTMFRCNIVIDSAADFMEDSYKGIIAIPYSTGRQARLLGSAFLEAVGMFWSEPRATILSIRQQFAAEREEQRRHKLIDN